MPFSKNRALIESTWLSKNDSLKDYESQKKVYLNNLGIKHYKINYWEEGAIPLFYPINRKENNKINIGTAGGMTRPQHWLYIFKYSGTFKIYKKEY